MTTTTLLVLSLVLMNGGLWTVLYGLLRRDYEQRRRLADSRARRAKLRWWNHAPKALP